MAWRDNLRPASFRGVSFFVDGTSLTAGRRLARHEYPQRDEPYLEDMGRKAREYKVEALIVGANYMAGRDALLQAIEEAGPGQLVHPYHGTLQVVASGETQFTESTREGGMVKVSITFIEAGRQQEPQAATDTELVLLDQYNDAELQFADDFAAGFSVDDAVDFVVDDAMASVNQFLILPDMALGNLDRIRADPTSLLRSLLPENLRASLSAPLQLAKGVLALVRRAGGVVALFDFSLPGLPSSVSTPSRQLQAANRTALTNLVQQAATARRIVDLASASPAALDEARTVRAEIVARTDAVLLNASTGEGTADAFVQLRTDAIQHFGRQTAGVPRLLRVRHQAVLPAIAVAYDFYGDGWLEGGRDADLIGRNRVRHPGFVPAGQDLQLLSQ